MNIERRIKPSFSVIGKEGSTMDGQGFVQKLWEDANAHFDEVQPLAKKDENGNLIGIWGAMSDCGHSFEPWEENFSKGIYLAGVECAEDAQAPEGWTKWTIPGYEYLCAEVESENTFSEVLDYMRINGIPLAGAVHDFICPSNGKSCMFFPVRRI
ncbi:MAG: AraC family transcriptional regulator [Oscillospiraceae bacterium]|nr:AraC family transcriptional regulator [Oscillospiraceae bacterium]